MIILIFTGIENSSQTLIFLMLLSLKLDVILKVYDIISQKTTLAAKNYISSKKTTSAWKKRLQLKKDAITAKKDISCKKDDISATKKKKSAAKKWHQLPES